MKTGTSEDMDKRIAAKGRLVPDIRKARARVGSRWRYAAMAGFALGLFGASLTGQSSSRAPAAVEELIAFATGAPEIDESLIDRVIHVSPGGDDSTGDGTEGAPYRTVATGLEKAGWYNHNMAEGVKVLVAAGVYVEGAIGADPATYFPYPVGGKPIILQGAGWSPGTMTGDVIISGAEPWAGWADNGDGTWSAPWPHDLGTIDLATVGSPPSVPEAYPKRDRLFVDGVAYYQFANASDPTLDNRAASEGAFWIDTTAQTITALPPVGSDFAAAVAADRIAASTRISAFYGYRSGAEIATAAPVAIRNIRFERFGENALRFQNSNGLIIEDCQFTQCRHYGLIVQDSRNNTLRRLAVNDNGVTGFNHEADNALAEDIELKRNGRQAMLNRFLGWGYGGMKIGTSSQVSYRRWEVRDNEGVSVWFDTGLAEVDFSDSVITGSKTASIFVENNNALTIADPGARTTLWLRELYIADSIGEPGVTDGKGIQFAASENVVVEDCVIHNADFVLNFPGDDRGPQRNITLRRNIVSSPGVQPLFHVAYGTNGWRESGQFDGIEGAFDTFSAVTNDNSYFRAEAGGFLSRDFSFSFSKIDFSAWQQAHLDNIINPSADRAVDSRSTFSTSGYSGQPLVVVRPVTASVSENAGLVDGFLVSRVANDTSADLVVSYTVAGSAVAGTHYSALPGSVVIAAGSRSAIIPLELLNNGSGDVDVTLALQPDAASGYLSLAGSSSLTIADVVEPALPMPLLHGLNLWHGVGGPQLELLLRRDVSLTYASHVVEVSATLAADSWEIIWASDGSHGNGNLIEQVSLEDGLEELRYRDPQAIVAEAPRFIRTRRN
jgi:parallel beta-helix repeat protein